MTELQIGQLTAQMESVRSDISDIKIKMDKLMMSLNAFPNDMEKKFVTRLELMPIKSVLSMVVLTTVSALCIGIVQIFFDTF